MSEDQLETENGGYEYVEQETSEPASEIQTSGDANAVTIQDGEEVDDEDDRKLFVGGLSWETTQQNVKDYFSKFGEVTQCIVKTDPNTGRSRGFGFVVFKDKSVLDVVMQASHSLNGKKIDPKRANKRPGREALKKVFVGGVDPDTAEETLREYFQKFGKIAELALPIDKIKNQRRNFIFVMFETEEGARQATKELKHKIGGKEVDVKIATQKTQDQQQGGWGWGGGGGRGGRGRGGERGWAGGRGGTRGGRGRGGAASGSGWGNQGWNGSGYDSYNYGGSGYGNYDYSNYYGNYGGYPQTYDYSSWGQGYDQSGYGQGYGGYGGGYDYSGWSGYGGGDQSGYGKAKPARGGAGGYKPY